MASEGLLAKLDFDNIPNMDMIGDQYKSRDYDPNNEYCVPYTWGVVGLIYNTTMVDGEIDSWDALWDEKYAGNVLMFNNSRDAFAIAAKRIGLSMNPTTVEEIEQMPKSSRRRRALCRPMSWMRSLTRWRAGKLRLLPIMQVMPSS